MNNLKYTIELDAKGKLIPELKIVKQQMDRVTDSVKSATGQFREMGSVFSRLSSVNLASATSNLKGMFEAINGISNADLGIGFQQSMADLKAITGIVGSDFERLAVAARKAGRETGLSVEDTAGAIEVLSQMNVKGSEAGTALRNVVLKLWEGAKRMGTVLIDTVVKALKPVWKWGEKAWNAVKQLLLIKQR